MITYQIIYQYFKTMNGNRVKVNNYNGIIIDKVLTENDNGNIVTKYLVKCEGGALHLIEPGDIVEIVNLI